MAEKIFDLIARVSYETNKEDLEALNKVVSQTQKETDELTRKSERLERQLSQTADPSKQKRLNSEYNETRKQLDKLNKLEENRIANVNVLINKQRELKRAIDQTTNVRDMERLVRELKNVDTQINAISRTAQKAQTQGSKLGGFAQTLLQGFGIGIGVNLFEQALGVVSNFVSSAFAEIEESERTLSQFKTTLENIGRGGFFDELVSEADTLASTYQNLFDNDDIINAQKTFIEGTKVSRQELSKLIPVAIELAAKLGTDVVSASELLVNAIIGRTSPQLKRLGLNLKDVKDETGRVNAITGDFARLLEGSVSSALDTTAGKSKQLGQEIANLQEDIGASLQPLKKNLLEFARDILSAFNRITKSKQELQDDLKSSSQSDEEVRLSGLTKEQIKDELKTIGTIEESVEKSRKSIRDFRNSIKKIKEDNTLGPRRFGAASQIEELEGFIRDEEIKLSANIGTLRAFNKAKRELEEEARKPFNTTGGDDELEQTVNTNNIKPKVKAVIKKTNEELKKEKEVIKVPIEAEVDAESFKKAREELFKAFDEFAKISREAFDSEIESSTITPTLNDEDAVNLNNQLLELYEKRRNAEALINNLSQQRIPYINDEVEAINELDEAQKSLLKNTKEYNEATRQKRDETIKASVEIAQVLASEVSNFIGAEVAKKDAAIRLQEERVNKVRGQQDKASKQSIKIEEERLEKLRQERERFARAQRIIDAGIIVSNQAVAASEAIKGIAKAASQGGAGAALTVAANIAALVAGIAASTLAIRNAFGNASQFYEGGYTGDGNPRETSTALGKKPYIYHKGEYVMPHKVTSENFDLLEGLHKGKYEAKPTKYGYYITEKGVDVAQAVKTHETIKMVGMNIDYSHFKAMNTKLDALTEIMKMKDVTISNNFDSDGFGMSVASSLTRVNLIKDVRRG